MHRLLSSIGIIGGADGPTAIFVAVSPDWPLYAVGAAAIAIAILTIIIHKKRKK